MKNINLCLSFYKKGFSILFVSFLLLNSLSFLGFMDGLDNLDDIYTVTSLSKYYNLMSLLPIKLANEFLEVNGMNVIDVEKQTNKQNKKNSKKQQSNNDVAYSSASLEHGQLRFVSDTVFLKGVDDFAVYTMKGYKLNFLYKWLCIFVMLFVGSMMLARGDTDDSIMLNKNILYKFRLV